MDQDKIDSIIETVEKMRFLISHPTKDPVDHLVDIFHVAMHAHFKDIETMDRGERRLFMWEPIIFDELQRKIFNVGKRTGMVFQLSRREDYFILTRLK